jgi:2,3-bisphosphoglycerate-dependent phosphoglycerate mutase
MDLLLVRHARPLRREVAEGPADPGLHEEGRAQAQRLAWWLSAEHVDALLTSPARRARETAAPLGEVLGLEPAVEEGLAEFDAGASAYVPIEELRAAKDERWRALARGELLDPSIDPMRFRERVVSTVEGVIARHPGRVVVAVCHGGVINAYVGHILGVARPLWFAPRYSSISRVAASRRGPRSVVSLNETGHLRALRL